MDPVQGGGYNRRLGLRAVSESSGVGPMAAKVFVSYRREQNAADAGRMYDKLADHFGRGQIFKDVDNLPKGTDFRKELDGAVNRCDVVLVVIGPKWLNIRKNRSGGSMTRPTGSASRSRLHCGDIRVIPVLVENARMPRPDQLPEVLRDLAFRQKIDVRPDPDFHRDMEGLIRAIKDRQPAEPEEGVATAAAEVKPRRKRSWRAQSRPCTNRPTRRTRLITSANGSNSFKRSRKNVSNSSKSKKTPGERPRRSDNGKKSCVRKRKRRTPPKSARRQPRRPPGIRRPPLGPPAPVWPARADRQKRRAPLAAAAGGGAAAAPRRRAPWAELLSSGSWGFCSA